MDHLTHRRDAEQALLLFLPSSRRAGGRRSYSASFGLVVITEFRVQYAVYGTIRPWYHQFCVFVAYSIASFIGYSPHLHVLLPGDEGGQDNITRGKKAPPPPVVVGPMTANTVMAAGRTDDAGRFWFPFVGLGTRGTREREVYERGSENPGHT
jgi:hypothetical protein